MSGVRGGKTARVQGTARGWRRAKGQEPVGNGRQLEVRRKWSNSRKKVWIYDAIHGGGRVLPRKMQLRIDAVNQAAMRETAGMMDIKDKEERRSASTQRNLIAHVSSATLLNSLFDSLVPTVTCVEAGINMLVRFNVAFCFFVDTPRRGNHPYKALEVRMVVQIA